MDIIKSKKHNLVKYLRSVSPLIVLFIALFVYWRMSFYYYLLDEMTMLSEFFDSGWSSIFHAQNEHFAPFFKILLYSYPKLFGNAVMPWRDLCVFTHFLAVVFSYLLVNSILKNRTIASFLSVFFGFSPLMWETMYMQSGLGTTSSVFAWLLTLFLLLKADETGSKKSLYLGYLLLVLQSYTFGNNLFYPLVIIALYILKPSKFRATNIGFAILVQAINVFIFLKLGSFENNRNFAGGTAEFSFGLLERMATYFAISFYANFGRSLVATEPSVTNSFVNLSVFVPFLCILVSSLYVAYRAKDQRAIVLTGWINFGLVIGLISVARYRLPYEQTMSSRYIYLIMPGIMLVLAPTIGYFSKYFKRLPEVLIALLVLRYSVTYSGLQHERRKAEMLHARNYQLIVFAKDHPGAKITDFLATAYLPTDRVVGMLKQYESEKRFSIEHRIPESIKSSDKEIRLRIKLDSSPG